MIQIIFSSKNKQESMTKMHEALKGNEGYINNDIMLCDIDEADDKFALILGERLDNYVELEFEI